MATEPPHPPNNLLETRVRFMVTPQDWELIRRIFELARITLIDETGSPIAAAPPPNPPMPPPV